MYVVTVAQICFPTSLADATYIKYEKIISGGEKILVVYNDKGI